MNNLVTILIFLGLGAFFVFFNLLLGAMVRPKLPTPEKHEPYECGEVPIGNSWVQFDLRFYIVALVFLVFDVEVTLFYPWATIFQEHKVAALLDMLVFFGVILVGYVYLWRFGYLDWVRSNVTTSIKTSPESPSKGKLRELARKDPETIEA